MGLSIKRNDSMEKQLLHMVFGGRVKDPTGYDFEDLKKIDFVGVFPNFKSAEKAWRSAAQRTVDDAQMKYVVVHLHRLMDPSNPDSAHDHNAEHASAAKPAR
jgi:Domain of unknown function (DUF4170)